MARGLPDVERASALITAAAMQLICSIRSPTMSLTASGMQVCSASLHPSAHDDTTTPVACRFISLGRSGASKRS